MSIFGLSKSIKQYGITSHYIDQLMWQLSHKSDFIKSDF